LSVFAITATIYSTKLLWCRGGQSLEVRTRPGAGECSIQVTAGKCSKLGRAEHIKY